VTATRNDIDIVLRLRIGWTSCHDRVNEERSEAADEIERLRTEIATCRAAYEQAIKDRDDARRRYCHEVWQGTGDADEQRQLTPREIAAGMGWRYPEAKT
jgi:hypothetical protein